MDFFHLWESNEPQAGLAYPSAITEMFVGSFVPAPGGEPRIRDVFREIRGFDHASGI